MPSNAISLKTWKNCKSSAIEPLAFLRQISNSFELISSLRLLLQNDETWWDLNFLCSEFCNLRWKNINSGLETLPTTLEYSPGEWFLMTPMLDVMTTFDQSVLFVIVDVHELVQGMLHIGLLLRKHQTLALIDLTNHLLKCCDKCFNHSNVQSSESTKVSQPQVCPWLFKKFAFKRGFHDCLFTWLSSFSKLSTSRRLSSEFRNGMLEKWCRFSWCFNPPVEVSSLSVYPILCIEFNSIVRTSKVV